MYVLQRLDNVNVSRKPGTRACLFCQELLVLYTCDILRRATFSYVIVPSKARYAHYAEMDVEIHGQSMHNSNSSLPVLITDRFETRGCS